jgi:hypothetical protein
VFESRGRLTEDIQRLIDAIRGLGAGRYACLLSRTGILFESAEEGTDAPWMLRRFLEPRVAKILEIPKAMNSDQPMEDLFEDWVADEFLLAVVNERVALVVACPDAERLKEQVLRPMKALADRLLRYEPSFRMDTRGRGFFFGRPRLDLVVVGRPEQPATAG